MVMGVHLKAGGQARGNRLKTRFRFWGFGGGGQGALCRYIFFLLYLFTLLNCSFDTLVVVCLQQELGRFEIEAKLTHDNTDHDDVVE